MDKNIAKNIRYIGCDDPALDLFEGQYPLVHGVSYNSYVILDEKVAVLDTADGRVREQWFANLRAALGERTPDYLIVSHMEPDHARNIGQFLETYPQAKIVGNAKTFTLFSEYFSNDVSARKIVVKEGDELSLGAHTLSFLMAPMVHWPEVMMEYEKSEKILFSADAFGKFGTVDCAEPWTDEARRYYCNIVGKYGPSVQAVLKKAAGLDIKTVCPLHGPVLQGDLAAYIAKYDLWSRYEPEEKGVVVAYASIHGNTAQAARILRDELASRGEKTVLLDLSRTDVAEAVAQVFRFDRMALASSTYDAGLFPCMQEFLTHLKSKAVQNRTAGLVENGSWAPAAGRLMGEMLSSMKNMTVLEPTVTVRGAVKEDTVQALAALAEALHAAAK